MIGCTRASYHCSVLRKRPVGSKSSIGGAWVTNHYTTERVHFDIRGDSGLARLVGREGDEKKRVSVPVTSLLYHQRPVSCFRGDTKRGRERSSFQTVYGCWKRSHRRSTGPAGRNIPNHVHSLHALRKSRCSQLWHRTACVQRLAITRKKRCVT